MNDFHELAPAYVLDALDGDERLQFEEALAHDPDLQAEVDSLSRALLPLAVGVEAVEPPSQLRDVVLTAVDGADQERSNVFLFPGASKWMSVTAAALAVAAVVLILVAVVTTPSVEETMSAVLAAEDRRVVEVADGPFAATVTYSPGLGLGVFTASGVPDLAHDQTYQLWVIDDEGAAPAGVFRPGTGGAATVLVDGSVDVGKAIGVTVEPSGGSNEPTGDVILVAPLT